MFTRKNALPTTFNECFAPSWLEGQNHPLESRTEWTSCLSTDLIESDEQYFMFIEVPGIEASKIDVWAENGLLTVKGKSDFSDEYKSARKGEQANFLVQERANQSFMRRYPLPFVCAESTIKAYCRNGVLELAISKKVATSHQTRVEVRQA